MMAVSTGIVRAGEHSDMIAIKVADVTTGYFIDLFVVYVKGNVVTDPFFQYQRGKAEEYPLEAYLPSIPCVFEDAVFRCPNDPVRILKAHYKGGLGIPKERAREMEGKRTFQGVSSSLEKGNTT